MCQALSSYFSSQTEPIPQTHIFQKETLIFNFRETDPAFNAELIFAKAAGHTAMEPSTMEALVGFSEKCKTYFK